MHKILTVWVRSRLKVVCNNLNYGCIFNLWLNSGSESARSVLNEEKFPSESQKPWIAMEIVRKQARRRNSGFRLAKSSREFMKIFSPFRPGSWSDMTWTITVNCAIPLHAWRLTKNRRRFRLSRMIDCSPGFEVGTTVVRWTQGKLEKCQERFAYVNMRSFCWILASEAP
jgi:hypothetical protein